jgi:hypothetical protein
MPSFADITTVKLGETVPDWRDIIELTGEARARAIMEASHHVWMWVHARAQQGDKEFVPAGLAYTGGKARFAAEDEPGARQGWRWDGVFSNVYITLWPTLNGKLSGKSADPDTVAAGAFRGQVSSYLRRSKNAVNIYRGSHASSDPALRTPQWFIADTWDATPPPADHRPVKKASTEAGHAHIASKLTPKEAGEDRAPAPVVVEYTCRRGCRQRFPSPEDRKAHEVATHQAQPAAQQERAPATCRFCAKVLSNSGNRYAHEKNMHPGLINHDIMPFRCFVENCGQQFTTSRGLSIHLGTGGTHNLSSTVRKVLLTQAAEAAEDAAASTAAPQDAAEAPGQAARAAPDILPEEPVVVSHAPETDVLTSMSTSDLAAQALRQILSEREELLAKAARADQYEALEQENQELRKRLAKVTGAMKAMLEEGVASDE